MNEPLFPDADALASLCRRHRIRRLSLFGSTLKGTARPGSDVDLLVEFSSGAKPGLIALSSIELEFSSLLGGRKVDLRTPEDLVDIFATKSPKPPKFNMQPDDAIRIRHMIESAEACDQFCLGRRRSDLESDLMLRFALVRAIEVIGEAASKVTLETRRIIPDVPWPAIVAMRNRLVHAYFDIDLDVLWKTATEEAPALLSALRAALADESDPYRQRKQ